MGQTLAAPDVEEAGAQALKLRESAGDVTNWILDLLSAAMSQFKKYRSPRMRRNLLVQVGEEYVAMGDYANGWKLLSQAIWEGRREYWPKIHRRSLRAALPALFALGGLKDYVAVCLELLAPEMRLPATERRGVEGKLVAVLSGRAPTPETGVREELQDGDAWQKQLADSAFFSLDLSNLRTCLLVRAWLSAAETGEEGKVSADGLVRVRVALLLKGASVALAFSQLTLAYSAPGGGASYAGLSTVTDDGSEGKLRLEPGTMKLFEFFFSPAAEDVGGVIGIKSVGLAVGRMGSSSVFGRMEWSGETLRGRVPPEFAGVVMPHASLFKHSRLPLSLAVAQRSSRLQLELDQLPEVVLLDQPLSFRLLLSSDESSQVSNLVARANCEATDAAGPRRLRE